MKIRHFILFLAILALSACAQAAKTDQLANASAPASPVGTAVVTQAEATIKDPAVVIQTEATNKLEAICFRYSEETQLLINSPQGYCLQYPVGYDIAIGNGAKIMVVKHSPLNSEDPNVFIDVEPAGGRTVEQVADQLIADYTVPGLEVKRESLVIDGAQAIRIDGLTGQDPNRHVVVIHDDRLYHLTFTLQNTPDMLARTDVLYNTVIQSLTFHPETNLCTDCPPASATP
jgi:hypothetical protein